jgi:hypothetical protein
MNFGDGISLSPFQFFTMISNMISIIIAQQKIQNKVGLSYAKNHNISSKTHNGALSITPYLPNNGVPESSKFTFCDLHGTFFYLFQIVAALNLP